jgi:uncharacterized protein YjbI with pentapeptide repeats
MIFNWHDLWQSIADLRLQIIVIMVILIFLLWLGFVIGNHETRLSRPANIIQKSRYQFSPKQLHRLSRNGQLPLPKQPYENELTRRANFRQGMSTGFFGAVVTTLFLGLGVLIFDQYQDIQNRKADLILQMGSLDHTTAIETIRQLRAEGWIEDGTLRGVWLCDANLKGASLWSANMQETDLGNFQNRTIQYSTSTWGAIFYLGARGGVNLEEADLRGSNLYMANLSGANLKDAKLDGANLEGAILPDGSSWTLDIDMARFTNPNHSTFWNPCVQLQIIPWYCED